MASGGAVSGRNKVRNGDGDRVHAKGISTGRYEHDDVLQPGCFYKHAAKLVFPSSKGNTLEDTLLPV